ncbi:MAG: sulfurtransferase [Rhodoferax sp.]
MKHTIKTRILAAWLVCGATWASAGVLPGPVVDTQWLAANLDKVQVVSVLSDAKVFTAAPEYEKDPKTGKSVLSEPGGHIAGSMLIGMKPMRVERQVGSLKVKYLIPEKAEFEKLVQSAGVDAGKPIVFVPLGVDIPDVDDALRVYWQFKVYGEDNMAVLNGGLSAWLREGRPVSTDAPVSKAGTWAAKADRSGQYLATSDDVAHSSEKGNAVLVDARDARNFHGLTKRDYVFAMGHIPGAKLYTPNLLLKSSEGSVKFMSVLTYKALMSANGIDPQAPVISYCNSGHLAAGPWFLTSEILGNRSAKLYDGSMHQWTLEKRPVAGAVPLN